MLKEVVKIMWVLEEKEERTEVKVVCPTGGTSKNSNENKTNNTPTVKNDLLEQIITHQQHKPSVSFKI